MTGLLKSSFFLPPLTLEASQEEETHGSSGIEHTCRDARRLPKVSMQFVTLVQVGIATTSLCHTRVRLAEHECVREKARKTTTQIYYRLCPTPYRCAEDARIYQSENLAADTAIVH